ERRALGDASGVGAHVRDETDCAFRPELDAFVQILRHAHGPLGAEAEFLGGFLLHRAGGEGRRGILSTLAPADVRDRERLAILKIGEDGTRRFFAPDLGLLAVELMELRREALLVFFEQRLYGPILDRLERTNLALALDDES